MTKFEKNMNVLKIVIAIILILGVIGIIENVAILLLWFMVSGSILIYDSKLTSNTKSIWKKRRTMLLGIFMICYAIVKVILVLQYTV